MKLRQHDKLKETLKSDSNWEDYYEEIKPLLGLRELGFTRIFPIFPKTIISNTPDSNAAAILLNLKASIN